jgi:hypothetical protein
VTKPDNSILHHSRTPPMGLTQLFTGKRPKENNSGTGMGSFVCVSLRIPSDTWMMTTSSTLCFLLHVEPAIGAELHIGHTQIFSTRFLTPFHHPFVTALKISQNNQPVIS